MLIKVKAHEDAGWHPLVLTFEYESSRDGAFLESARGVSRMLAEGRRININQALLLASSRVVQLLQDGAGPAHICSRLGGMIPEHLVMVGVPQMTRALGFYVVLDGHAYDLRLETPLVSKA